MITLLVVWEPSTTTGDCFLTSSSSWLAMLSFCSLWALSIASASLKLLLRLADFVLELLPPDRLLQLLFPLTDFLRTASPTSSPSFPPSEQPLRLLIAPLMSAPDSFPP